MKIVDLEHELIPLRIKLQEHKIYKSIKSIEDIRLFMEHHVFAVWDFMSLLKQLQNQLSCTKVPWLPSRNPEAARLINEIVWGEESDLNRKGIPMSHFEMYLESMQSLGASSQAINELKHRLKKGQTIDQALDEINLPQHILSFLRFTFEVVNTKKNHIIAAVFTFGREDLIPDMFIEIIKNLTVPEGEDLSDLIYYFKRHIELDADEHGPMALKMVTNLCEGNVDKITEALAYSKKALELRIGLWDGILRGIEKPILA
ncbi:MAG: DUF3050 domain-containing protein [Flavobacteriales bacterium]|jgi:hypothetical protein|tara:strand:+ start:44 stop:820 length:777 start_codon:yes stop_codon:yes gene_type:complete